MASLECREYKNWMIHKRANLFLIVLLSRKKDWNWTLPILFHPIMEFPSSPLDSISTRLMGFSYFFLWLLLIFSVFSSSVPTGQGFTGTYGVNYGRIADNLLRPTTVVTLLKAAKIKNIRIYDADHSVLNAFNGSGIGVTVGLGNEYLIQMSVGQDPALSWVKENVEPYLPGNTVVGIAVGNEILGGTSMDIWEALLPATKNVYSALQLLGLHKKVEVSSPNSEAVFANSYPPSACVFKEDVLIYMQPLLQFFSQIGSPFYINAYPFLAYKSDPEHIDIKYALFQSNPGIIDTKTNLHYDNMFMAQVDAAYFALEKAGFPRMEVIVSETGWASKGDQDEASATVKNAKIYNYNLKKLLSKKKGTPYRPKIMVRAYIFALFNENLKPGPTSERNFGLFKPDGSAAYNIGLPALKESSGASSLAPLKGIRAFGWTRTYSGIVLATCTTLMLLMKL